MTPLERWNAEVRHILEWAIFIADGIEEYKRSTGETS